MLEASAAQGEGTASVAPSSEPSRGSSSELTQLQEEIARLKVNSAFYENRVKLLEASCGAANSHIEHLSGVLNSGHFHMENLGAENAALFHSLSEAQAIAASAQAQAAHLHGKVTELGKLEWEIAEVKLEKGILAQRTSALLTAQDQISKGIRDADNLVKADLRRQLRAKRREIDDVGKKAGALDKKLSGMQEKVAGLQRGIDEALKAQQEAEKAERHWKDKHLRESSATQKKSSELRETREQLTATQQQHNETLERFKDRQKSDAETIRALRRDLDKTTKERDQARKDHDKLKDRNDKVFALAAKHEEMAADAARREREIRQIARNNLRITEENEAVVARNEAAVARIERDKAELENLMSAASDDVMNEWAERQAFRESEDKALAEAIERNGQLRQQYDDLNSRFVERGQRIDELSRDIRNLQNLIAGLRRQIESQSGAPQAST